VPTFVIFADSRSSSKKRTHSRFYTVPFFAEAGGLASYGVDLAAHFGQAATYVDRILRGARPADLPVQQPTKFKLVINVKTAKGLGITVPQSLLVTADEVIE
jgi:putative ABC transport system substrate-binding protein